MKKTTSCLLLLVFLFIMPPSLAQDVQKASPKARMIYKAMKTGNIMDKVWENMINKPKRETNKVIAKKINS